MIRRIVISLSVAVYAFFAFSEIAQVNPLYDITFEDTKEYIIGDLEVTMLACRAKLKGEQNYTLALAEYRSWHNYIKNKYSGMKGINEAIKVASLAAWDSAMNDILLFGISAQIYIDAQEVEAATGESNELSAEAKKLSLEKSAELQTQITSLETQTSGISRDLESLASSTTTSLRELSESNQTVTATLQEQITEKANFASQATAKLKEALDAKAAGDETEYKSLWNEYNNLKLEEAICDENIATLKKEQTNISTTINGLTQASSLAVTTAAKLKEVALDATYAKTMIDFKLSGSDWRNASKWLGYNPSTDETLLDITNSLNVFFTPKRFKAYEQGETATFYNISEGNRIFDLLSDMGYVTAVDEDMDEAYTQTEYQKTKYRFQLAADPTDITRTNTTANFSAPANWVDQVTIKTNANNKYVANGTPTLNEEDWNKIVSGEVDKPPYYFIDYPSETETGKSNLYASASLRKGPLNWFNVLNDKEKQDAESGLSEFKPTYFFHLKEETGNNGTITNTYAMPYDSAKEVGKRNGFPAPKNWVDGTSIVCTDGVYRASSYTNALNGLEEDARKKGVGGYKGKGLLNRPDHEVDLNDPNDPLNPNSGLYPLNPSYDPDNVDNTWFHLFTHTDSDITWSKYVQSEELGQLSSIIDLGKDLYTKGKFSKNLTNVFSLANFPMTHPYQFPFVHIANPGTRYSIRDLCWADSTNCFEVTANDSQSEYPEVEYDFNIKGFAAASEGQVPYKRKKPDGTDSYDIAWTNALGMTVQTEHNGATAAERTGETQVPVNTPVNGQRIIFRTADDSDIRINVSTNGTGDLILTFGAYWK